MDVAHKGGAEAIDEELTRLIERRARKGGIDPDEQEERWKASVRRYNARRQDANRLAWREHHQRQAACLRATLDALISHHEEKARELLADEHRGEGGR